MDRAYARLDRGMKEKRGKKELVKILTSNSLRGIQKKVSEKMCKVWQLLMIRKFLGMPINDRHCEVIDMRSEIKMDKPEKNE